MTDLAAAIIGDNPEVRDLVARYGHKYVQAFIEQRRGLLLQKALLPKPR